MCVIPFNTPCIVGIQGRCPHFSFVVCPLVVLVMLDVVFILMVTVAGAFLCHPSDELVKKSFNTGIEKHRHLAPSQPFWLFRRKILPENLARRKNECPTRYYSTSAYWNRFQALISWNNSIQIILSPSPFSLHPNHTFTIRCDKKIVWY